MLFARLLPTTFLICSLPAVAQDYQPKGFQLSPVPCSARVTSGCRLPGNVQLPNGKAAQATPSEPWRIIRKHELNAEWLQDPADYYRQHPEQYQTAYELRVIQYPASDSRTHVFIAPNGQLVPGRLCYSIHSYVVARDEDDSDSTHLVKSSTCQLAKQYHLKIAELPSDDR